MLVAGSDGTTEVVTTGLRWRTEVRQQVFEEAAADCGEALTAFSDSRKGKRAGRPVGFPRFKRKRSTIPSFRLRSIASKSGRPSVRVGDGKPRSVTIPGVGVIAVREDTRRLRRMLTNGRARILPATVKYYNGRWTASVRVAAADLHHALRHPPRPVDDHGGWVGVDRGLSAFVVAATADGQVVCRIDDPPRPLRTGMGRQRRLSRAVTGKPVGSANRAQAAVRLRRHHTRIAAVREHFLHEAANRLVQTHDRVALEDLTITGMLANHHLAAAIADAGWGRFARIVDYKLAWRGGQVALVDRWFPSSKTCSTCHTVLAVMPLHQRTYTCGWCGLCIDRDVNAAINLAAWAERNHAQVRDPDARGPASTPSEGTALRRRHPRRRNQP